MREKKEKRQPIVPKAERFSQIIDRIYLAKTSGRGKRAKLAAEYRRQMILHNWEKIVSENIARHAKAHHFSYDTLFVSASPVWANELSYLKRGLIDALNRYIGSETVKDIRFTAWEEKELPEKKKITNRVDEKEKLSPSQDEWLEAKKNTASLFNGDEKMKKIAVKLTAGRLANLRKKKDKGFFPCLSCGKILVKEEKKYCAVCEGKNRRRHYERIREKYAACPWANYKEINEYEPCRPEEANRIRQEMIRNQLEKVEYRKDSDKKGSYLFEEYILAMFIHSLPQEKLTDALMSRTLYEVRYDLKNSPKPPKKIKQNGGKNVDS